MFVLSSTRRSLGPSAPVHPWKRLCSERWSERLIASLLDHIEEAHIPVTEGPLFLRPVMVGLSVQDLTGDKREVRVLGWAFLQQMLPLLDALQLCLFQNRKVQFDYIEAI